MPLINVATHCLDPSPLTLSLHINAFNILLKAKYLPHEMLQKHYKQQRQLYMGVTKLHHYISPVSKTLALPFLQKRMLWEI